MKVDFFFEGGLSFSKFPFRFFGVFILVALLRFASLIYIASLPSFASFLPSFALLLYCFALLRHYLYMNQNFALVYQFLLYSSTLPFELCTIYKASHTFKLCFVPILYISVRKIHKSELQ